MNAKTLTGLILQTRSYRGDDLEIRTFPGRLLFQKIQVILSKEKGIQSILIEEEINPV